MVRRFSILLVFVLNSASADVIDGYCVTGVGPTTSFFFMPTSKNETTVQVRHANGVQYAPFWNSLVVPNDLKALSFHADVTSKLSDSFSVTWKNNQCQWLGEGKFNCSGKVAKQQIGSLEIEPWATYSKVVRESSFAGDFTWIEVTFSYFFLNENHQIVMKYQADECSFENQKSASPGSKKGIKTK